MVMDSSSSSTRSSSSGSGSSRTVTFQLRQPNSHDIGLRAEEEAVTLTLAPRLKKKVSWKEGTVDNEFLQRKSSKECCIFPQHHEEDDNGDDESSCKH